MRSLHVGDVSSDSFTSITRGNSMTRTFTYNKLRGRIVEKYRTQDAFAHAIGITKNALSRKMTCKAGISQEDIAKWCKLLDIGLDEIGDFFFT